MIDQERFDDGETRERIVEEVAVTDSAVFQRIIVPNAWGAPMLLASAERGALLLYSFTDMPHLLCWRLPDDEDVLVEILLDDDPRAAEILAASASAEAELDQAEVAEDDEDDDDADDEEDEEDTSGLSAVWVLPDDIDEERLRYPSRWGRPNPIVDAWIDGGPLLLSFGEGEHILRWDLAEDILLSLVADDSL